MAVGDDVGKYPGVTHELLVRDAGQDGNGESHLWEGVEQLLVLDQRHAAIEQVLPLIHAGVIDRAINTDHEIERQFEVGAELGERPEDEM